MAGPGTGKTQLLSAKVAYTILEHTDANPENILCLTFTDAGAENMRDRLQTMIGKAALDVNIYTYHAFGSNVLERAIKTTPKLSTASSTPQSTKPRNTKLSPIFKNLSRDRHSQELQREGHYRDNFKCQICPSSRERSPENCHPECREDSQAISAEISPIFLSAPARMKFDQAVSEVYGPVLEILAKYTSPEPITGGIERIAKYDGS